MRIQRHFTTKGQDPYATIAFTQTTSEIRNPDGSVVFKLEGIEVPADWSQVACDILAQKYFRKAGVPARLKPVEENTVPSWLWRCVADEKAPLPWQKEHLPNLTGTPEAYRPAGSLERGGKRARATGDYEAWQPE